MSWIRSRLPCSISHVLDELAEQHSLGNIVGGDVGRKLPYLVTHQLIILRLIPLILGQNNFSAESVDCLGLYQGVDRVGSMIGHDTDDQSCIGGADRHLPALFVDPVSPGFGGWIELGSCFGEDLFRDLGQVLIGGVLVIHLDLDVSV